MSSLEHNIQSDFLQSLAALKHRDQYETKIQEKFPATSGKKRKGISARNALRVFKRDKWCCRYTGEKLVYRGYLKALSILAPTAFPYHKNGRRSLSGSGTPYSHQAYWSHQPSIDHIIPVGHGGSNDPENLFTTSAATNTGLGIGFASKVGLALGDIPNTDWNGCVDEFIVLTERFPDLLSDSYILKCQKELVGISKIGWHISNWE